MPMTDPEVGLIGEQYVIFTFSAVRLP